MCHSLSVTIVKVWCIFSVNSWFLFFKKARPNGLLLWKEATSWELISQNHINKSFVAKLTNKINVIFYKGNAVRKLNSWKRKVYVKGKVKKKTSLIRWWHRLWMSSIWQGKISKHLELLSVYKSACLHSVPSRLPGDRQRDEWHTPSLFRPILQSVWRWLGCPDKPFNVYPQAVGQIAIYLIWSLKKPKRKKDHEIASSLVQPCSLWVWLISDHLHDWTVAHP